MILLWPCRNYWISSTWSQHLARPGYNRAYAGVDLAGPEQPLYASQHNGKVLQSMWSTVGYGYTTFVEYYDQSGSAVLRCRNAHQKSLAVATGDRVQVGQVLGILDSTGNSTGNHTHFETWLRMDGNWQNIDPLDDKYGIKFTHNVPDVIPLDGTPPVVGGDTVFTVPEAEFVEIKTSAVITSTINLRQSPFVSARIVGSVWPGQTWQFCGSHKDILGNTWFAIRRYLSVGWAAAHYNGETWLEAVQ